MTMSTTPELVSAALASEEAGANEVGPKESSSERVAPSWRQHSKHYLRQRKARPVNERVPRRRTRRRISTEVLPLPRNGEFYTLQELGELTDHLVKMHRHYPASDPHWKPVKRQLRRSVERAYRRFRAGPPPELSADPTDPSV